MILGAAQAARESASPHLGPGQPPDEELRRSLALALGAAAFDANYGEGKRLHPAQALRLTSSDYRDSPGQVLWIASTHVMLGAGRAR